MKSFAKADHDSAIKSLKYGTNRKTFVSLQNKQVYYPQQNKKG
jgi:hypothetical protein